MATEDDDEGSFESVERRGQPRGSFRGLSITLSQGVVLEITEASQLSFFGELGNPDQLALGLESSADLRYRGQTIREVGDANVLSLADARRARVPLGRLGGCGSA